MHTRMMLHLLAYQPYNGIVLVLELCQLVQQHSYLLPSVLVERQCSRQRIQGIIYGVFGKTGARLSFVRVATRWSVYETDA